MTNRRVVAIDEPTTIREPVFCACLVTLTEQLESMPDGLAAMGLRPREIDIIRQRTAALIAAYHRHLPDR